MTERRRAKGEEQGAENQMQAIGSRTEQRDELRPYHNCFTTEVTENTKLNDGEN